MSLVLLAALFGSGCRACNGHAELAVQGPSPYVRCLAAPAPPDATVRAGRVVLRRKERVLAIEGLRLPARVAAFSGPAFAPAPSSAQVAALRRADPQLVLLLGGLGDTAELARATAQALAELPVPVLILAGGRDTPERIEDAIQEAKADRIMDITALRAVRIGRDTFIPVAGAADGRYALADGACGYGATDLEAIAAEVGPADQGRRWLLAWEAPAEEGPHAVASTEFGSSAGSPALAALAAHIGARGGLFAWPYVRVLRPSAGRGLEPHPSFEAAPDLRLVVPRIAGPPMERGDGARVPAGFALLELNSSGMRLLPNPAAP